MLNFAYMRGGKCACGIQYLSLFSVIVPRRERESASVVTK